MLSTFVMNKSLNHCANGRDVFNIYGLEFVRCYAYGYPD